MDYTAILEALDARTQSAFQAWAENTLADFAKALGERDDLIACQAAQIKAMQEMLDQQDERLTLALGEILREGVDAAQKQVRLTIGEIAIPTYKGVFDRDAEYQPGAMVTHKGSVWHCNALVNGEAPGTCDAWTLAVKCGRDGKDAWDAKAEATE